MIYPIPAVARGFLGVNWEGWKRAAEFTDVTDVLGQACVR